MEDDGAGYVLERKNDSEVTVVTFPDGTVREYPDFMAALDAVDADCGT